jgi:hypothetical protein
VEVFAAAAFMAVGFVCAAATSAADFVPAIA